MIIQCTTCNARFRLDEAKIKGRGARVRCRRCGESIVVIKPEGSEPPPLTPPPPASSPAVSGADLLDLRSVVRESLGEQATTPAPSAADEPSPPFVESVPQEAKSPIEEPPPRPEVEEGDLLFARREHREAPPPSPPQRDEVDLAFEKLLSTSGLEEAPFTAGTGELPGPGELAVDFRPEEKLEIPKEAHGPETPPRPDFLLSDTDSMAFLKEAYERGEKREVFDISLSVTAEPRLPDAGEEPAAAPPPAGAFFPPAEPYPAQGAGEPAGDLEDSAQAAPAAPVPEEPPAVKAYPRQMPPETAPDRASFLRPSVLALILGFVALAGGGAYLGFTKSGQELLRRLIPGMESLWLRGGKPGPQYDVRNLIGYYEPNTKAGTLFIIKGSVANAGRSRKSGIRIHAALLDSNDRPIAERTCYAGNVLAGETLRSAPREKIDEALSNRFGDRLVNMDIAPGKSVPFMVVFYDVPEGINAYRLEAKDGE